METINRCSNRQIAVDVYAIDLTVKILYYTAPLWTT